MFRNRIECSNVAQERFLLGMSHARLNVLHLHVSEFCRYALHARPPGPPCNP